jgi:hypothetical protein
MNLERIVDIILRIYPRAFRERFGDEFQRDFLAEFNAAKNRLEVWRLVADAFSCAIWERLQSTPWVRPLAAASCISACAFGIVLMTHPLLFEQRIGQMLELAIFGPFILLFPAASIATLERVPHRLEIVAALFVTACGALYTGSNLLEAWLARDQVLQIVQQQLWFSSAFAFLANLGILLFGLAGLFVAREHWRTRAVKIGLVSLIAWTVLNPLVEYPFRTIPFFVILTLFAYVFATSGKAPDAKSV